MQSVRVGSHIVDYIPIIYGVPQDLKLGSILFIILYLKNEFSKINISFYYFHYVKELFLSDKSIVFDLINFSKTLTIIIS